MIRAWEAVRDFVRAHGNHFYFAVWMLFAIASFAAGDITWGFISLAVGLIFLALGPYPPQKRDDS